MAHAAQIVNDVVTQVIVINSCDFGGCDLHLDPDNVRDHSGHDIDLTFPEIEPAAQAFIASIGLSGEFKLTSYNSNFRGKYAGQGDRYDAELDEFVSPVVEQVVDPEAEAPVA